MLTKRTYKNQITLPKDVLKDFPEVDYFDVTARMGEIILRPVKMVADTNRLAQIREKIQKLGLTLDDLKDAAQWARRQA